MKYPDIIISLGVNENNLVQEFKLLTKYNNKILMIIFDDKVEHLFKTKLNLPLCYIKIDKIIPLINPEPVKKCCWNKSVRRTPTINQNTHIDSISKLIKDKKHIYIKYQKAFSVEVQELLKRHGTDIFHIQYDDEEEPSFPVETNETV